MDDLLLWIDGLCDACVWVMKCYTVWFAGLGAGLALRLIHLLQVNA